MSEHILCSAVRAHAGLTVTSGAPTGAVTLLQRFGSALNLNVHMHMLVLDGAYTFSGKRQTFHRAHRPIADELNQLLDTLTRRIVRVLERRGCLVADPEYPYLDLEPDSSMDHLQAASIHYRIAIGRLQATPQLHAGHSMGRGRQSPCQARLAGSKLQPKGIPEGSRAARTRLERGTHYDMRLTLEFLWNLAGLIAQVFPLLLGLGVIIGGLSVWVGRKEGWSIGDSLYFGFITALTVGYGDLRPTVGRNKFIAIVIALFGLITTGVLVALAVEAAGYTFDGRSP